MYISLTNEQIWNKEYLYGILSEEVRLIRVNSICKKQSEIPRDWYFTIEGNVFLLKYNIVKLIYYLNMFLVYKRIRRIDLFY